MITRYMSDGCKLGLAKYSNSFDESKIKRDEDGKFAGKTRSGKDVYKKFDHPGHSDFSKEDHQDAEGFHRAERDKADDSAFDAIVALDNPGAAAHEAVSGYHSEEAQKHLRAYLYGPKGAPKPREKKEKLGKQKKELSRDMSADEIRKGEDEKKRKAREKSFKSFGK